MHSEPIMMMLDITNKECIMTASTAIILIILVVIVVFGIVWVPGIIRTKIISTEYGIFHTFLMPVMFTL